MSTRLTISMLFPLILLSPGSYAASVSLPVCISQQFGSTSISNKDVMIEAPDIAENGAVVGVGINAVKNIPQGRFVKQVSFYNEFRKEPIASFKLSRTVSAKNLKTRVRLRESTNLYAVARLDDGTLLGGQRHIKVTIGGCGGGEATESVRAERVCSK